MDTVIEFLRNLQGLLEPLNSFLGSGGEMASSTASSTTATSSIAEGLGETLRTAFILLAKVLIWGIDLVRQMLVKLLELLS